MTIFEYRRDRNIGIYIWPIISHVANTYQIAKQSHLGKCSNEKLRTVTLVNEGTLRNIADFASALGNVNNVKISDLLAFIVNVIVFLYLFSPENRWWWRCTLLESWKIMEKSMGIFLDNNFKKSQAEVSFYFHLQLRKTILEWLLPYEVTLVAKCKKSAKTSEIKISN